MPRSRWICRAVANLVLLAGTRTCCACNLPPLPGPSAPRLVFSLVEAESVVRFDVAASRIP